MRFDQIDLETVPAVESPEDESFEAASPEAGAPRLRRLASLITDLSLFVALTFVLLPLLPQPPLWFHGVALGGFVVMVSYYYFVGSWLLWGKTIGGVIFDVTIVPESERGMSLREASVRWAGFCLSLLTAGLGFALAALPAARSLPDRMSGTRSV